MKKIKLVLLTAVMTLCAAGAMAEVDLPRIN